MILAYRFEYKGQHLDWLLDQCEISRCLYNQTLFQYKRVLINDNKYLSYYDLNKLMPTIYNLEGGINYKLLKAQCSQHCIKQVDNNLKSYYESIKDYNAHPEKYTGRPHFPRYIRSKYNVLTFTNQACSIKNGFLNLNREIHIRIPQWNKYCNFISKFNQVRIVPNHGGIMIEILYEKTVLVPTQKKKKYAAVDLGVNNVMAVTIEGGKSYIFKGGQIKSLNRWYSKEIGKAQSKLRTSENKTDDEKQKHTSNKINQLYKNRENEINDLEHKMTRHLVNLLELEGVTDIIFGYNSGWKQSPPMHRVAAQMFEAMPFTGILNKMRYKCEQAGINLTTIEESYTSKCDALALEPIGFHSTYKGERKRRGKFCSSTGCIINADINGSLNIMRKVAGDGVISTGRGLWSNPVLYHNLYELK